MMSEDDATVITERATQYMMKFLVQEFSTFSDLKRFLPDETPLHHAKIFAVANSGGRMKKM